MSKNEELNFPNDFNIIPVPKNSKVPAFKWEKYQKIRYDKPIPENNSNYAVICGKISNNLLVLDIDLREKKHFKEIISQLAKESLETASTRLVETPHGYHLYYYMNGFVVKRKKNENARYNKKFKFTGVTQTNFKEWLKGFDILGEGGYAITWNSQINGSEYKIRWDKPIRTITEREFNQLKNFFLLDKPIRMRKPFYDILNGKIEIEEQASNTGKEEFLYWKALFFEVYHYLGLEPEELFEGLKANQPSFDVETTRTQLQYHDPRKNNPFTNEKLKEMFPEYQFRKPEKSKKAGTKKRNNSELEMVENLERNIAQRILDQLKIITVKETDDIYIYEKGIYRKDPNCALVRSWINKISKDTYVSRDVGSEIQYCPSIAKRNTILELIKTETFASLEDFDKDPYVLNLENGLLNILTEELIPHTPEYLSFRRIPLTYDPDALCPEIDNFLLEIFYNDDISFVHKFLGLCLTPIMIYQIALLFYGKGNNGKTTVLNLFQRYLGKENCSNVDISQFKKDSFFAQIEGKLFNVVPDIDTKTEINIQRFKDYVGNTLQITIRNLYQNPRQITPTAKIAYSCNTTFPEIPKNTDKGFWRKWVFIECPYTFDKKEVANKLDQLINEREFSGLLNKAIKAFQQLHTQGRFEDGYYDWEGVRDLWLENKNIVQEFITLRCVENPKAYVLQDEFVARCNQWLAETGRMPLTDKLVTRRIKSNPHYHQDRKQIAGTRLKVYKGIGFKEKQESGLDLYSGSAEISDDKQSVEPIVDRLRELFEDNDNKFLFKNNVIDVLSIEYEKETIESALNEMQNNGLLETSAKGIRLRKNSSAEEEELIEF